MEFEIGINSHRNHRINDQLNLTDELKSMKIIHWCTFFYVQTSSKQFLFIF